MADAIDREIARRVEARITELGTRLAEDLVRLTQMMHGRLAAEVEPVQHDEILRALLHASIESNLETLVHILRDKVPLSEAAAPTAALSYARRLAQLNISAADLARAYRLGQQIVVDWGMAALAAVEPDRDVALASGRQFARLTFTYVDAISEQVVEAHEIERERCVAHRNTVRAALVEDLIAGGTPNVTAAETTLGYRLRQNHVAVVLWTDDLSSSAGDLADLERALDSLATAAGAAGPPLFLPRERSLAWGWIPLGRSREMAEPALPADPGGDSVGRPWIALGTPQPGPEGFRISHAEALRARRVAQADQDRAQPITSCSFTEVRIAGMLAADLDSTRWLVQRALGSLAADNENAERLRDTLRVFLIEKGSFVSTGERLHLHRNTVKYRVDKAIADRGRPVDDDRLELELALIACRWLGSSVLPTQ